MAVWYDQFIEQTDGVMGGEPCIAGTRISVLDVVESWELFRSFAEIIGRRPELRSYLIMAALGYYADHRAEIEGYRTAHNAEEKAHGMGIR